MAGDRPIRIMLAILTGLAIVTVASHASTVLAPLVLAVLIIAVVWPLQSRLQTMMPKPVAMVIVVLVTAAACVLFASILAWGFTRVARTFILESRHQTLYDALAVWLDGYGLSVVGLWDNYFNTASLLTLFRWLGTSLSAAMTLGAITLIYVILGLLEVDAARRKVLGLENRVAAEAIQNGFVQLGVKLRRYGAVRTLMSAATGLSFGFVAWLTGLQHEVEWALMAFALNYIPVIGSFIATTLPSAWAFTQFGSVTSVIALFACLNIIQFAIGSYLEPRVAGNTLSISPLVVLFSVFLWSYLWGVLGAFIGVPITIAVLAFCEQHPATCWIAVLLGGERADYAGDADPVR
jgi:AI-2 transport protein TqsA